MSEPEVRALVEKISELKDQIKGYVALHSYGQDILYPWGHAVNQYPKDVEDLVNTVFCEADLFFRRLLPTKWLHQ